MPTAAVGPWLQQAIERGLIDPKQLDSPPRPGPVRAPAPPARDASEEDFQGRLIAHAKVLGWRCYHTRDSRRSPGGFPDLVLLRAGVLILAELKSAAGRPTAEQREWLADLAAVPGVRVRLWRPADWPEIVPELEGGAPR